MENIPTPMFADIGDWFWPAVMGVLALIGILIRNSIILVHEIEVLKDKGRNAWDAVFEASDSRARPILLTAAAASLVIPES